MFHEFGWMGSKSKGSSSHHPVDEYIPRGAYRPVRREIAGQMGAAWILTIPATALVAYLVGLGFKLFGMGSLSWVPASKIRKISIIWVG